MGGPGGRARGAGLLTFIPGSHRRTELGATNLLDKEGLFEVCPDMRWQQRATVPLRAGDATFHHGRTTHMATPNLTDVPRVAHAVIYMDAATTYTAARRVVTDPLGLRDGQVLDGEMFPRVGAR